MVDISIKLDDLGFYDKLSPAIVGAVESSIQTSLALIKDRWQTEAQNKLLTTRPDYLMGLQFNSIQMPFDEPLTGAVVLLGDLPNAIEVGYNSFDMKPGFSKSPRITRKDNGGWFLTIPFRHMTPGAFMYGNSMPKDVYGVAKNLNPYQSGNGNTRLKWGAKGDASWNGYQHKSNKYNGMVRIVKSYQNSSQSQYMTFRRVSDTSDPNSWHHPGYAGAHIAEKIQPYAKKTFVDILSNNLKNIV